VGRFEDTGDIREADLFSTKEEAAAVGVPKQLTITYIIED
jgi:hypothetical protein